MLQIQEKQDSLTKNLNLLPTVKQQKALNISRKVIDTQTVQDLHTQTKTDSAKRAKESVGTSHEKTDLKVVDQKRTGISQDKKKTIPEEQQKKENITSYHKAANKSDKDTLHIVQPQVMVAIPEMPVKTDIVLPEKIFARRNSDWVIGVVILSLIIIASVRIIFSTYLKQLFNATFNYSTATRLLRERTFNLLHAAFRLDLLFYLVLSLFIYQNARFFEISVVKVNSFVSYLMCFVAVVAYFVAKRFVYALVGFLAESQAETSEYLFNVNIYNRILGIVLFPISLTIAFVPLADVKWLIFIGLFLVIFCYGMILFRGARILFKKHFSISYLILYLCTLEILPLLVIYKIITG